MIPQLDLDVVGRWLDRYIAAWRTCQPAAIGDLFTEDVRYEPEPYTVLTGRDAVVAEWLEDQDEPGTWRANYEPVAIDGWLAVATGVTRYFERDDEPETVYHNAFLLEFDPDGRCRHYREWYMREE